MISERTLRNWRRDALKANILTDKEDTINHVAELHQRILKLTQDLLDLHLLRKE